MPFKDIHGQEEAITLIQKDLRNKRFSRSYLFCGPEGVGKKMAALAFAQALNCSLNADDACGECISCRKIAELKHPDLHLIMREEKKSSFVQRQFLNDQALLSDEIKVEQIRKLQKEALLKPYEARFKVFIIEEAHLLNEAAANCFLKTLEEPPLFSVFILITDKSHLIFKTILSRCRIIKFKAWERRALEEKLKKDYLIKEGLAHFLAYFYEGRLGAALKGKEEVLKAREALFEGFKGPNYFVRNFETETLQSFKESLNLLNTFFRDLYLLKCNAVAEEELINLDRKDILEKFLAYYSKSDLERVLGAIAECAFFAEENVNRRLILQKLKIALWKN